MKLVITDKYKIKIKKLIYPIYNINKLFYIQSTKKTLTAAQISRSMRHRKKK
jgi:hypothetical protein